MLPDTKGAPGVRGRIPRFFDLRGFWTDSQTHKFQKGVIQVVQNLKKKTLVDTHLRPTSCLCNMP